MSDLVGNPEDRFSRVEAQLFLFCFVCCFQRQRSLKRLSKSESTDYCHLYGLIQVKSDDSSIT